VLAGWIATVMNTILLEVADWISLLIARGGLLKLLSFDCLSLPWAFADITATIELDGLRQKPTIRLSPANRFAGPPARKIAAKAITDFCK